MVQEAYAEASAHREDYFCHEGLPLFLWLRGVVGNKLLELHRRHLGTRMRAAGREVCLQGAASPDATSAALARELTCRATRPSLAAARAETNARLQEALHAMDPIDREAL